MKGLIRYISHLIVWGVGICGSVLCSVHMSAEMRSHDLTRVRRDRPKRAMFLP